jgi:hypothetical protein
VLLGRGLAQQVIADRYVLDQFLGEGGFGVVYSAREQIEGDYIGHVAVKLCPPPDEATRRQLVREVQAMSQLAHPSLVGYRVCGAVREGPLDGAFYIVMELCDRSLRVELTERGALPASEVTNDLSSVAEAVAHMHAAGAVHRDIKPENILLAAGRWKLGDMGLARAASSSLTTASRQIGTLAYMSPEMIDGKVGPAADIYALGVTVAECLTGRLPFRDNVTSQIMKQILTDGPTVPEGLSAPWDRLLPRMLAPDPAARPDAREVLDCLRGMPTIAGVWSPWDEPAATAVEQAAPAPEPPEVEFARACDEIIADGVVSPEEKASIRALAERLVITPDRATQIFVEAAERRAKLPLTVAGERRLAVGAEKRQEACHAIAELYGIPDKRVWSTLERAHWDVDLAMSRLEAETELDRQSFALLSVCEQARVTEDRAREVLEYVQWDADAAMTYIRADDEKQREAARQAAAQRVAERKEKAATVAKVAGGVLAGAAVVAVTVAAATLMPRPRYGGVLGGFWSD